MSYKNNPIDLGTDLESIFSQDCRYYFQTKKVPEYIISKEYMIKQKPPEFISFAYDLSEDFERIFSSKQFKIINPTFNEIQK